MVSSMQKNPAPKDGWLRLFELLKEYLGFKSRLLFDLPFIISCGKNIEPNKLSVENKQIIKDQDQRGKEIFVLHCIDSFNFREMEPEVSMKRRC